MNKISKKNIVLGAIGVVIFVCIGLGFYNVFSKANASEVTTSKNETIASNKGTSIDEDNNKVDDKEKENLEGNGDAKKDEANNSNKENENNNDNTNSNAEATKTNQESNTSSNEENKSSVSSNNGGSSNNGSGSTVTPPVEKPETTPAPVPKKSVTISIGCQTALGKPGLGHLPSNGVILNTTKVEFEDGETVFDVLQRVTRSNEIHMEYTGSGSTIYIEGIYNLYEFDGGPNSGWMYCVNGWYPNYGAGVYNLKDGDVIQWNYTCDLGEDLGAGWNGQ